LFVFSCDKEKQSRKNLDGVWEITSYEEIIYDGTTEKFDLDSGMAIFTIDKKSKLGTVEIQWNADNAMDTSIFNFIGDFEQISLRDLQFRAPNQIYDCGINRQLKKDMILEMVVNPNRKSVLVLKAK
jgi:hypothetical protein